MLTPPALAAPPLTLATIKVHLKLDPADTSEDTLLDAYLKAAIGTFRVNSKRRWPEANEPVDVVITDPTTVPPTGVVTGYSDHRVLSTNEQAMAESWLLLTLGHLYENRQSVAVGINLTELPLANQYLMNLLREPTI